MLLVLKVMLLVLLSRLLGRVFVVGGIVLVVRLLILCRLI